MSSYYTSTQAPQLRLPLCYSPERGQVKPSLVVKMLVDYLYPKSEYLDLSLCPDFKSSFLLVCALRGSRDGSRVWIAALLTWETWMEFSAPGFDLAQPR